MSKAAHHKGTYQTNARKVVAAANANPLTLCRRCKHTLAQHPPHHNGKPPRWTAGHVQAGSTTAQPWLTPMVTPEQCDQASQGDWLAPEVSNCNYGARDLTPATASIITTRNW